MKVLPNVTPFEGYKVYGPYLAKREGRMTVRLRAEGRVDTMLYSRYLMCVKLGRRLTRDEHVDHINNDKTDDRLDNLQVLSARDNIKKSMRKPAYMECTCGQCGKTFSRLRRQVKSRFGCGKDFCSRQCSGAYYGHAGGRARHGLTS